ncbi:MAG: hypothetical protein ACRD0K_18820 [Egibacteraceae bacterium]
MNALLWIVVTVAVPLLLAEFTECGRWLAQRLLRWSARRLRDPEATARYEEEWLADLAQVPGNLTPLFHSLGVVVQVRRLRHTLSAPKQRQNRDIGFSARLTDALITGLYASLPLALTAGLGVGLAVLFGARPTIRVIIGRGAGVVVGVATGSLAWTALALGAALAELGVRLSFRLLERRRALLNQ